MKLFADENLEQEVIEVLRRHGHDVATLAPGRTGADDPEVLAVATSENRIFVTNDKDFAELAFLQRQLTAGIVLVRLPRFGSDAKARRVAEVIDEQAEADGRLHRHRSSGYPSASVLVAAKGVARP